MEEILKLLEEMKASAEECCKICKDANRENYAYYYGREMALAAAVNIIRSYIASTAIDMINNGEIIIGEDDNEEN